MTTHTRRAAWIALTAAIAMFTAPLQAATPILYSTSFNDASGVQQVYGGQPMVAGGTLRLEGYLYPQSYCPFMCTTTETAAILAGGNKFSDGTRYDISVRFDSPSHHGMHGGMLLSSTGQYRYGQGNALTLDYMQSQGRYRLHRYVNGAETSGPQISAPVPSGWHRWTMVVRGTRVDAAIDGAYLATMTLPNAPGNLAMGAWTWHGGTISFDDAVVRSYAAPTVLTSSDITVEATGPSGAVAHFAPATAHDGAGTSLPASCNRTSGSLFTLGTTSVQCSATDLIKQTTTESFTVTVVDTTPPVIAPHTDLVAEATGPDGAAVSYSAPATSDAVDGSGIASCVPASGSTFPLGDTSVACSATDAAGNSSSSQFQVSVVDTTPPVIEQHEDLTFDATGPDGALVSYDPPATHDAVDGEGVASCTPVSGSLFAVGDTTVTCSAVDAAGNVAAPTTFDVRVEEVILLDLEGFTGRTLSGDLLGYQASVVVTYTDGGPAEGATVAVSLTRQTLTETLEFHGVSGPDGRFTFQVPSTFVLPSDYEVSVQAALRTASESVADTFTVGIL